MALVLTAVITLTLGIADHTDEGLLNEQQERIGFMDLESDGAEDSSQEATGQEHTAASTSNALDAT